MSDNSFSKTTVFERENHATSLNTGGRKIDKKLLQNLSPLGWEHINLIGDYMWKQTKMPGSIISDRYSHYKILNVLYNPNSVVTPI
ncbi:MAG: Tn3 family transposase [Thermoclostridium sp.]|nr:Tn3 family transposase [Thermoclostridium sp.]